MATILVVDDRLTNRQYLTALLGACGHETFEATNGAEALAFVRAHRPDLVITDILMPTMDGYQFAQALRDDPQRPRIIFHTATYSGPTARQMAESCGVEAVVLKPCEPAELLETVNRVLGLAVPPVVAPPAPERYGGAALPADYNLARYVSKLEATKRGFDAIAAAHAGPAAERALSQAQSEEFAAAIAELRRLLFRLTVLIEVGTETAAERDAARLVEIFFGAACEIIRAERAAVAIFDERDGALRHMYAKRIDIALLRAAARDGALGVLAAGKGPLRWSRHDRGTPPPALPPGHPAADSLLGVAVMARGQCHGWLYFADRHDAAQFGEEDERFAVILAEKLALFYENAVFYEKVDYLAYYDVLTGLPNATLFQDRLGQRLHGGRATAEKLAVILVDLDRFTHVNDTLGRHAGDSLLQQVAQRLGESLGAACSLARVGANTFAAAVPALKSGTDAAGILEERILHPLAQPFRTDGGEIRLGGRAGIAIFPEDGDDAVTLQKRAEFALKQAKTSGDRFLFYSAQANARAATRIAVENQLREAVRLEQFVLHFQPKVDLASGRIVGAEALIRWQHPERGLVAPEAFIPIAEESGLIEAIGAWVIRSVCAHQARWIARCGATVPVAFNLSALQLRTAGVLDELRRELARHALDMDCVAVELTESAVMVNVEEAMRTLAALRQMGMALSLDDFGTGYSSLAYLKRLPFHFVKIDKSFIADIVHNPEDAAIAKAIIAMAHLLNLHVVAEGVETQAQADYLRENGCDEMQGYFVSRPLPGDAFETMLRSRELRLPRGPLAQPPAADVA